MAESTTTASLTDIPLEDQYWTQTQDVKVKNWRNNLQRLLKTELLRNSNQSSEPVVKESILKPFKSGSFLKVFRRSSNTNGKNDQIEKNYGDLDGNNTYPKSNTLTRVFKMLPSAPFGKYQGKHEQPLKSQNIEEVVQETTLLTEENIGDRLAVAKETQV